MTRPDEGSRHGLRVQTVLHGTDAATFGRFVQGMSAACALAKDAGRIATATLAVADLSRAPWASAPSVDELADELFDETAYVRVEEDVGPAGAHNRLFEQAGPGGGTSPDVAIVAVPHAYAGPRLVGELLTPLADPKVGIVEARQLPLELSKSYDPDTGDTSWASATCFLVRTDVIEQTGGFDTTDLAWSGYDVDLSWRARQRGWRVVHRPGARVFVDDRLEPSGVPLRRDEQEPEARRHRARARVLLPWRYNRPDVAVERLASLTASSDAVERAVAEELRARIDGDAMPEPVDPEHAVGQFVAGGHAVERFSYQTP